MKAFVLIMMIYFAVRLGSISGSVATIKPSDWPITRKIKGLNALLEMIFYSSFLIWAIILLFKG